MKQKKFNLIEIALAIGILAIGVTAIMSLFSLGFQEIRDSVGENYSSEAADSMLAYIARVAYHDWDDIVGTNASPGSIPRSKPTSKFINSSWSDNIEGDIWDDEDPDTDGIFGIKVVTGSSTDFSGEMLIWESKVKDIRAAGDDIAELDYDSAVVLHLEISWPVEKPYAQREQNTYYFELFNYNQ
jgi:hypothetical protein